MTKPKERLTVRNGCMFCTPQCREETPLDFDCFDDGCQYECCGCGACCMPSRCPETGKGHVWHQ